MSDGQEYNGHNTMDRPDELFHSQQIAGWRAEVSAFLQDCLMEVQSISNMLQSPGQRPPLDTDPTKPAQPEPAAEDTAILTSRQYESMFTGNAGDSPTIPPPPTSTSTSNTEEEFDTRLANLKQMLADKLTSSESQSKFLPGQQSHE